MLYPAYAQQDMDLLLNNTLLPGKNILKVKRDFYDPYLWVLAQNNEVYRINSLDMTVDDYTGRFRGYSTLPFIDIAGVSKDVVYVATKSVNLIESKFGVFKTIGTANGIVGVLNSIGIDYTGTYIGYNIPRDQVTARQTYSVLIGTDNGMCHYDYTAGEMMPGSSNVPARVFEANYRSEMFSYLEFGSDPDPVILYPALTLYQDILGGNLWYGKNGAFGNNLNTAYYTEGVVRDNLRGYEPRFVMNFYWGTEKGLFQNFRGSSKDSGQPYHHYLNDITVNKIASIYGLRAFGSSANSGLIKENLLIGTDQGLYFSNSGYWQPGAVTFPNYAFFHLDVLGNKVINDIETNATSYTPTTCEDGIWVAATDGLYLLKPDYSRIDNSQVINAIQFDGANAGQTEIRACGSASASVQASSYSGKILQWYKDGQPMPGETNTTLKITQPGDYHAILYDPCSPLIHFATNHLKVTSLTGPSFTFNYPDQLYTCYGIPVILQTDNNPAYQYRWYKDGALNGNTTNTLSTTQDGKYQLEVATCPGGWVASKEVQIYFIKVAPPVLTADKPAYCMGEHAKLSITIPTDASGIRNWQPYTYRWFKDGVQIAGTSPVLDVTQAGKYKVEVTSCAGNSTTSAEFELYFISIAPLFVTTDKPGYCMGDVATLSTGLTINGSYTLNWLRNGVVMAANQNKSSITVDMPGSYIASLSNSAAPCSQTSLPVVISFNPPATISLERLIKTTLCSGQAVDLKASYSGGTIKWSNGERSDQISVKNPGKYTATITSPGGCSVSEDIDVQFLNSPTLSIPDATLCQFTNDKITLTATAGFVKYVWNGQAGSPDFTTNALGQVTLTVTDNNGCTATQTINITSRCKDIHIPNTFTPNGDGTNDKWLISGLEGDASVNVKVYTRAGTTIFESQGYALPWDGTYKGTRVAAGVYFYVIATKGSKQVLSGSVTVIR